jgi:hypothetical protein
MKKSNFALKLQPSLMEEAKKVAKAEGVTVNQLINVAVAEKVSANIIIIHGTIGTISNGFRSTSPFRMWPTWGYSSASRPTSAAR